MLCKGISISRLREGGYHHVLWKSEPRPKRERFSSKVNNSYFGSKKITDLGFGRLDSRFEPSFNFIDKNQPDSVRFFPDHLL